MAQGGARGLGMVPEPPAERGGYGPAWGPKPALLLLWCLLLQREGVPGRFPKGHLAFSATSSTASSHEPAQQFYVYTCTGIHTHLNL